MTREISTDYDPYYERSGRSHHHRRGWIGNEKVLVARKVLLASLHPFPSHVSYFAGELFQLFPHVVAHSNFDVVILPVVASPLVVVIRLDRFGVEHWNSVVDSPLLWYHPRIDDEY
jgi:hypothetical protein